MMAASTMGLIPEALKIGGFPELALGVYFGVLILTLMENYTAYRHPAFKQPSEV